MRKFLQGRWAIFFKRCFKIYIFLQIFTLTSIFIFNHYETKSPVRILSDSLKAKEIESLEKQQKVFSEEEKFRQSLSDAERKQLDERETNNPGNGRVSREIVRTLFKWGLFLFAGALFFFVQFCCLLIPIVIYCIEYFEKFKVYRKTPNKNLKDHFRFWIFGRTPEVTQNHGYDSSA